MNRTVKKMVYGSLAVAIVVGILCILDLILGIPFRGTTTLDIVLLICCAIVGYMGFNVKREQS
ncbi:hypothetical protein Pla110_09130 [Polystyrenella longa]|uniref:Uncharacterized protein n=1 Tax=Polystyrenella longa TaxID=2528007 RepID=A0A518CJ04_9PLAN|nr:hypothetical protein [Polystyrenella longa]QDU79208.1 hypothetical protein Pla110_09130 [Polystyrenella longa]